MQSAQIKSQTASILANLQKKISKYLAPSYEASDIFDKSKAMSKNHSEIIQSNKDFIKKNQHQEFIKIESQNPGNQFDQLLHRRRKCQAKLHSMLLDHQVEESLRFQFIPNKIVVQKNSDQSTYQDVFANSSLKQMKQVKSQGLTPGGQPNFLRLEKELDKMQKKIQRLTKKIDKKNSSKKITTRKDMIRQSQTRIAKDKKQVDKCQKARNQTGESKSVISCKSKSPSVKKGSSAELIKRGSSKMGMKGERQNSQDHVKKQKLGKNSVDQTSLFGKLYQQKLKQQKDRQSTKLKKVGMGKFCQASKKTIEMAKKNLIDQKIKNQTTIQSPKNSNKNRIKVNLFKCQSAQIL